MAGNVLNITPAAISKQMSALELRLGVTLFYRGHRSIELTSAGRTYLPVAERVLAILKDGRESARAVDRRKRLMVEVDHEFLEFFLMPRLSRLHVELPELELEFRPLLPRRHGQQGELAITFGHPGFGAVVAERLCEYDVFPVGCPDLCKTIDNPLTVLPLLHDVDTYWWDTILAAEDISRSNSGTIMGHGAISLRAAMAGQGLAVGDIVLCADALAEGSLIRIGTVCLPGRANYWLTSHQSTKQDKIVQEFRDWLTTELKNIVKPTIQPKQLDLRVK